MNKALTTEMVAEVTTLEQAGKLLVAQDVVDFTTMQVEGKKLLDVCGYSYTKKNASDKVRLQIEKHNFEENVDYFKSPVRGGLATLFTFNAAQHVLLAAMTTEGKAARQEAIDIKEKEHFILPDFTNPAIAARAWAEQFEQKELALMEVKQQKEQLTLAAPKVEFFDKVGDSSLVSSIGNVAKAFNVGRNTMFKQLREMKILQRNNVPYQQYIKQGYFQVKEVLNYNNISYTTYVTGKGQTWLHKKLKEACFID